MNVYQLDVCVLLHLCHVCACVVQGVDIPRSDEKVYTAAMPFDVGQTGATLMV